MVCLRDKGLNILRKNLLSLQMAQHSHVLGDAQSFQSD